MAVVTAGRVGPLLAVLLVACAPRPPMAPPPPSPNEPPLPARWPGPALRGSVRVAAVGDVLMHGSVKFSAARTGGAPGFSTLWAGVRPLLRGADFAFANLETPVAPNSGRSSRMFVFNVGPEALTALAEDGFDVISWANNHVWDQGRRGFVESLEHLDASGLVWLGGGRTCEQTHAPRYTEHDGLRLAWIASSAIHNNQLNRRADEPCTAVYDRHDVLARVAEAREQADVVVLSMHWGREYRHEPSSQQLTEAEALTDGGVDLILGHHAHVVQPVTVRTTADGRTAVIAYGLGNFVSNQDWDFWPGVHDDRAADARDGLLLQVDFVKKGYGPAEGGEEVLRVAPANLRVVPLWTDNRSSKIDDPDAEIAVVPVQAALDEAVAALATARGEQRAGLLERIALLRRRWARVLEIVGPTVLAREPTLPASVTQEQEAP